MRASSIVAASLVAGLTAASVYMVNITPEVSNVYRAETLNEALQVCGEVSSELGEIRACRDAAYAVAWPDWEPMDRCNEEDDYSNDCMWLATRQGENGIGDSYIVDEHGQVEYVN